MLLHSIWSNTYDLLKRKKRTVHLLSLTQTNICLSLLLCVGSQCMKGHWADNGMQVCVSQLQLTSAWQPFVHWVNNCSGLWPKDLLLTKKLQVLKAYHRKVSSAHYALVTFACSAMHHHLYAINPAMILRAGISWPAHGCALIDLSLIISRSDHKRPMPTDPLLTEIRQLTHGPLHEGDARCKTAWNQMICISSRLT